MPRQSFPIRDASGKVIGIACGHVQRVRCATAGCRGDGTQLCDYPVTRRGKATTCNRRVCRGCAKSVGPDLDYCPPHARVHAVELEQKAEDDKFRRIMAEFRPCEEVSEKP